jgi:hypothetical protein
MNLVISSHLQPYERDQKLTLRSLAVLSFENNERQNILEGSRFILWSVRV